MRRAGAALQLPSALGPLASNCKEACQPISRLSNLGGRAWHLEPASCRLALFAGKRMAQEGFNVPPRGIWDRRIAVRRKLGRCLQSVH